MNIIPSPLPKAKLKWHTCEMDEECHPFHDDCQCEEVDYEEYERRFGKILCDIVGVNFK